MTLDFLNEDKQIHVQVQGLDLMILLVSSNLDTV